jgi:hypothetical protein
MRKGPNNGVVVRGLRVVRTEAGHRRTAWGWSVLLSLLTQGPEVGEEHWHDLTVTDLDRKVMAVRRLDSAREADRVRKRFVAVVEALDDASLARQDWQSVLDAA